MSTVPFVKYFDPNKQINKGERNAKHENRTSIVKDSSMINEQLFV